MKIVPSEFSNSAWNCFILAKEIAYENHQQDVDSENLLLALIKEDNLTKRILKKNNVNWVHDWVHKMDCIALDIKISRVASIRESGESPDTGIRGIPRYRGIP